MPDQLRVMDLTLLPESRNKGIGSRMLRDVQSEARSLALPVTLHAEKMENMDKYYQWPVFEIVWKLKPTTS